MAKAKRKTPVRSKVKPNGAAITRTEHIREDVLIEQVGVESTPVVVVNGNEYMPTEQHQAIVDAMKNGPVPPAERSSVKKQLRCPSCWNTRRGRAARRKWWQQISGPLNKVCYVCGECGTEWVVEVRSEDNDGVLFKEIRVSEVRK